MVPRRGALGLRGRIVGAVLVTTVATLVVAALALLGPLEHSLRRAALTTLQNELKGAQANFVNFNRGATPDPTKVHTTSASVLAEVKAEIERLREQQARLSQRVGGTAIVFGYPGANGENARALAPPPDQDALSQAPMQLIAQAFRTGKPQYRLLTVADNEVTAAAIFFSTEFKTDKGKQFVPYVLSVTTPINTVTAAVAAVRTAFLYAVIAGLGLTLLLGIPLSYRIVRRLRRLREAALELAEQGPPVDVPGARARDEVGDLARAFALMQTQLQRQEEARRAFVATASHELRTPLTSLEGMLELLQDDLAGPHPDLHDARDMLSRARAQSHRLGRLAADLLDLSRLDAQVQLRSEPVELGELSRAVLAEFELGTTERSVAVELHESAAPVWALGDPGSVARILRILLDNAMRVSPAGSEIHVELSGGANAALRVCDQGPGVPQEERDQIFQRFHRGRNMSGQAGFGLGLAIGRELAQRMDGELVLEESRQGGATFVLRLPTATAPEHDKLALL